MEKMKTPEEAKITSKVATQNDLPLIEQFLSQDKIDNLFTPKLSDPIRGITIKDRVQKKFESGTWIIAEDEIGAVVGCLAIVPAKTSQLLEITNENKKFYGISLKNWLPGFVMELSTVATDPEVRSKKNVKGVGEMLLNEAIKYVGNKKDHGLVTDSWIGGEMDGFITHVLNKSNFSNLDFLIQIFKDISKRGIDGPPTTLYLIPTRPTDLKFIQDQQLNIAKLRNKYNEILQGVKSN